MQYYCHNFSKQTINNIFNIILLYLITIKQVKDTIIINMFTIIYFEKNQDLN